MQNHSFGNSLLTQFGYGLIVSFWLCSYISTAYAVSSTGMMDAPFDAFDGLYYDTIDTIDLTSKSAIISYGLSNNLIVYNSGKSMNVQQGRIDPSSISSYYVSRIGSNMTYCSAVAYHNLNYIVGSKENQHESYSISKGDAIDIWNQTTGTSISGEMLAYSLWNSYFKDYHSVFDIVTFLSRNKKYNLSSDDYVRQSHRFVVFLGSDDNRYVLDPIRSLSSDPIEIDEYVKKYLKHQEILKIVASYMPKSGSSMKSSGSMIGEFTFDPEKLNPATLFDDVERAKKKYGEQFYTLWPQVVTPIKAIQRDMSCAQALETLSSIVLSHDQKKLFIQKKNRLQQIYCQ